MDRSISSVLGISGSPRPDGNTDILVREALRKLRAQTGARTTFVRVADKRILPCEGCRDCMELGRCAVEGDDFEDLMAQVFDTDLLILGAPVYWYGPPGVMKNFIDRTHGYYADHTVLRGHRAALISVATDGGFESHEAVMASWLRVYGAEIAGSIRVYSCEKGEVLQRPDEFAKVGELVQAIVNAAA